MEWIGKWRETEGNGRVHKRRRGAKWELKGTEISRGRTVGVEQEWEGSGTDEEEEEEKSSGSGGKRERRVYF